MKPDSLNLLMKKQTRESLPFLPALHDLSSQSWSRVLLALPSGRASRECAPVSSRYYCNVGPQNPVGIECFLPTHKSKTYLLTSFAVSVRASCSSSQFAEAFTLSSRWQTSFGKADRLWNPRQQNPHRSVCRELLPSRGSER